jgi:fructose-1,6-bisphosphatase I
MESINFEKYLKEAGVEEGLRNLLTDLSREFVHMADDLKNYETGHAGSQNVYGENQLKADITANNLFVNLLQNHQSVDSIASEELEEELKGKASGNGYSVAFDPLDGSSLVDVNLTIGSIFGIYKGPGFIGRKGSEQVASIITVYGPRLTFMITVGKGVKEFIFDERDACFLLHSDIKFNGEKKLFAPGNLRACSSEEWYVKLLDFWVKNDYTLRYSGGMVPDVNQILKKGSGVFTYPGYKDKPEGKLRLLYECAPMAFLAEQAGGEGTSGKMRILDIEVTKLDQKTPVFLGEKKAMELVMSYMKGA